MRARHLASILERLVLSAGMTLLLYVLERKMADMRAKKRAGQS